MFQVPFLKRENREPGGTPGRARRCNGEPAAFYHSIIHKGEGGTPVMTLSQKTCLEYFKPAFESKAV